MKFYMFGGCEVQDSLEWLKNNYSSHSYERIWGTTIASLLSPREKIADSVYDWYNKLSPEEQRVISNRKIYKEILLKDHIDGCIVDNDTYIVISMLYEASTRFDNGFEHLTTITELQTTGKDKHGNPHIENLKKYKFPIDTYETINNDRFATSVYDSELAKKYFGGKHLEQFADIITQKFGTKVILLNIPPARKYYNNKHGLYNDLPKVSQFAYKFTDVSNMKIDDYDWNYHDRQLNLVYKYLYKKGFKQKIYNINIDWKDIIGDDHHRLGRSPFHFTYETTAFLGSQIKECIESIIKEKQYESRRH